MVEIFVVQQVGLPYHAEVLYGHGEKLALFELVKACRAGENGYSEVFSHQILYGGHIVHLQNDIEALYRHIYAFKVGDKEILSAGGGKTEQKSFLLNVLK